MHIKPFALVAAAFPLGSAVYSYAVIVTSVDDSVKTGVVLSACTDNDDGTLGVDESTSVEVLVFSDSDACWNSIMTAFLFYIGGLKQRSFQKKY